MVAGGFGNTSLAVLTGLGTVAALGVVIRALVYERRRRTNLQLELQTAQTALDRAEAQAQQDQAARRKTVAETQRLAGALRDRLGVPVG